MHAEEEARKLWCPMVRLVTVTGDTKNVLNRAAFNRCVTEMEGMEFNPQGTNCIASQCAMWRKGSHGAGCGLWLVEGTSNAYAWKCVDGCTLHMGYCGLGGKP